MPVDLEAEGVASSTSGPRPEAPIQEEEWVNSEGIKVPEIAQPVIRAGRRFLHGVMPFAEKGSAAFDTLLGTGKGRDYAENEKLALGRLQDARDNLNPIVGGTAELAGMLASPINRLLPGVGAANIPKSVVGSALAHGASGAISGGAMGGLSYLGETPNEQISASGLGDAATTGAKWGGGIGLAAGGVLGQLAKKKNDYLLQAIASTSGDLRQPGKAAGSKTRTAELNKALKIAQGAEEAGYIGGLGQDMATTHAITTSSSNAIGKEGEALRKQIVADAVAKGKQSFDVAENVQKAILADIKNDLTTGGARLLQPEREALAEVSELLKQGLMNQNKRGAYLKNTPVGIDDVFNVYDKVSTILRGHRGDRDFANSIRGQILFKTERKLKELFRKQAEAIDPQAAKALRDNDAAYHIAQTVESLTGASRQGEIGARFGGGLMGRVANLSGLALGSAFGLPGKLLGYKLGGKMAQRGVGPNSVLSMLRNSSELPRIMGTAGALSARTRAPTDD